VGNYIDYKKLEYRLSKAVVTRIYGDSNQDDADPNPVEQLISDAEQWFESVALGIYPDLTALRRDGGPAAVFLVLDCAEALACKRFPRAAARDWKPLWETADKQLMRLRKGEIKLPVQGSPNPPSNVGGDYYVKDLGLSDTQDNTFTRNGFGSF
jgi:hypothetical protein